MKPFWRSSYPSLEKTPVGSGANASPEDDDCVLVNCAGLDTGNPEEVQS